MHLLILGYSNIVQRRVLPAARSLGAIRKISIASRSHGPAEAGPHDPVAWFADYDDALRESGADTVYVSGINSEHAGWVTKALQRDLHVMVDKPAFLDVETAETAVALARQRGRGLAEATVFAFHPQVSAVQSLVPASELASTRVTAVFSIPPLRPGNFRNRAGCGGGSINDLGPYVAATNRLIFGGAPADIDCRVLSHHGPAEAGHYDLSVDTSFSVLLTHEHGGALAGHFGFVTSYQNHLSVLSPSRAVDIERFFTTPPDAAATLRIREGDSDRSVTAPAADAFALFLQAFTDAVSRNDFAEFERALLHDARLVGRLRHAAGRKNPPYDN